jgi:cyclic-di-AMP phosphodiesterase PgpH
MAPYQRHIKISGSTFRWASAWLGVVLLSFGALIIALGAPYLFGHKIQAGDIAEQDYVAHEKTFVVDEEKTDLLKEDLRRHMLPVFKKDDSEKGVILQKLKNQLDKIEQSKEGTASSSDIPPDVQAVADQVPAKDLPAWRKDVESSANRLLSVVHFYPGANHYEWRQTVFEFLPDKFAPGLRTATADMIANVLEPNMVLDDAATVDKLNRTLKGMKKITKEIKTGTLIVARGDALTDEDVSILKQMGVERTRDVQSILGVALALVAAFGLFGVFLHTYEPEHFYSPASIGLMATVCVVTSAIAAAVGHQYGQFIPLPATALVLSVIFGRRVAIVLALLVLIFIKVSELVDNSQVIALGAASAMVFGVSVKKRQDLMLSGLLVGMMQALAYFMAMMLEGMSGSALAIGQRLALQFLGGLSSCIVAIGSLPFLEMMFGIVTPFRISELTEPDQPLLRQLEENAPGTYQHSLAVANLAEAGAKAIGADVNLVRAGAIYHDIGKMVTPRFFIENQLGDKNPHDEISPEDSRAKVLAHVTNGLKLARQYGLPKAVQDFIPEHQGTTIMAYFYHKACLRDGAENVDEKDYRYPGPKPQTKETAIVMLADVSEAVTHSLKEPTQEEVETAIGNVFKARWDDGQFDESTMSEEEFEKVKKAFVRVWRTLHHERLKYPSTTTGKMPVPPPRG